MTSLWTKNQQKAIETVCQNMQIIACAGSGKTTTMVEHILYLLNQPDIEPENIVAITYTEKAAASLKQKIFESYEKNTTHLKVWLICILAQYTVFVFICFRKFQMNIKHLKP